MGISDENQAAVSDYEYRVPAKFITRAGSSSASYAANGYYVPMIDTPVILIAIDITNTSESDLRRPELDIRCYSTSSNEELEEAWGRDATGRFYRLGDKPDRITPGESAIGIYAFSAPDNPSTVAVRIEWDHRVDLTVSPTPDQ